MAYVAKAIVISSMEALNSYYDGTVDTLQNHVYVANEIVNNDTFTINEVKQYPERASFKEAMIAEIDDHKERNHCELVDRNSIPKGHKTAMIIWSCNIKRYPGGRIMKYKARLCAHGGQQKLVVNYWETYSPVVSWISVRLLQIVCCVLGLKSASVDFVLAFPQTELEEEIYMELAVGFEALGADCSQVLKLKKNLYGLKEASSNWYGMIKGGLVRRKFTPSVIDPCAFYKEGMIMLLYVDNMIVVSKKEKNIDKLIKSLREEDERFILTSQGDIENYLGV